MLKPPPFSFSLYSIRLSRKTGLGSNELVDWGGTDNTFWHDIDTLQLVSDILLIERKP